MVTKDKLKKKVALFALIVICVVGAVLLVYNLPTVKNCGVFSLKTYSDEMQQEDFLSDRQFDPVDDYLEAAECARILLEDDYSSLGQHRLNKYRADVYFDEEAHAWLVFFTLKSRYVYNELAADYYVIISTDGDVIARWGVK